MKLKLDMWILLGVTVLLLCAMIFIVLRLVDQSEMHVKSVKDIRVKYSRSGFRPEPTESERMIASDLAEHEDQTVANYRNYDISKQCMKLLGKMKNLHSLDLSDSNIGEDSSFRYLAKVPLQHLALSGTSVGDEAMKYIAKIETLESLFVYDTNISGKGLAALAPLSHLRHLLANGNPLKDDDIVSIKDMAGLVEIGLSGTRITDKCCNEIATMHSIEILDVGHTTISTAGLTKLVDMSSLSDFRMKSANLHDEQVKVIATFPHLRKLTIDTNPITDTALTYLAQSKSLTNVNINDCKQLTSAGIQRFRQSRPDLKIDARKVTETGEMTPI